MTVSHLRTRHLFVAVRKCAEYRVHMRNTKAIVPTAVVLASAAFAQNAVTEQPGPVERLRVEAATLRPLVSSQLVRGFLAATNAALGWHDAMDLDADLFAMYTILRRPAS